MATSKSSNGAKMAQKTSIMGDVGAFGALL
jgi:hypothetical protein